MIKFIHCPLYLHVHSVNIFIWVEGKEFQPEKEKKMSDSKGFFTSKEDEISYEMATGGQNAFAEPDAELDLVAYEAEYQEWLKAGQPEHWRFSESKNK